MTLSPYFSKKNFLFLFFFFILNFWSLCQDSITRNNLTHHLSLNYLKGFNTSRYISETGDLELKNKIGSNHALRIAYRLNFNPKFYTELGVGLGFQKERTQNPVTGFSQFENGFLENTGHFEFSRFDLTTAYQIFAKGKHTINVLGGAGINLFAPVGSILSYSYEDEYFQRKYDVISQITPFLNAGISYQIETKRHDLLGVKIYYNYGWKSFFDGRYTFNDNGNISSGRIESYLRGIHLGLGYTFTRNKKRAQIESYQIENNLDRRSAKKQHKFEKRAINPKSQFISLGFGVGITINKFTPKRDPFYSSPFGTHLGKISYEQGWKNNLFFEADYHGFNLNEGTLLRFNHGDYSFASTSDSELSFGHFLSAGMNYKIQRKKTNFQLFNVHAGIGLGAQFYSKGSLGGGSGSLTIENQEKYNYTSSSEVTGYLMPIVYTGISKDIRITQNLLFSLAYRYQFGLNTIYQTGYLISIEGAPHKSVTGKIDGTASLITFGLKYKIQ